MKSFTHTWIRSDPTQLGRSWIIIIIVIVVVIIIIIVIVVVIIIIYFENVNFFHAQLWTFTSKMKPSHISGRMIRFYSYCTNCSSKAGFRSLI